MRTLVIPCPVAGEVVVQASDSREAAYGWLAEVAFVAVSPTVPRSCCCNCGRLLVTVSGSGTIPNMKDPPREKGVVVVVSGVYGRANAGERHAAGIEFVVLDQPRATQTGLLAVGAQMLLSTRAADVRSGSDGINILGTVRQEDLTR